MAGRLSEAGSLKSTLWGWGGVGWCGGRLFEAGRLLTFSSGWALIQGWALKRINTVIRTLAFRSRAKLDNSYSFYFKMIGIVG